MLEENLESTQVIFVVNPFQAHILKMFNTKTVWSAREMIDNLFEREGDDDFEILFDFISPLVFHKQFSPLKVLQDNITDREMLTKKNDFALKNKTEKCLFPLIVFPTKITKKKNPQIVYPSSFNVRAAIFSCLKKQSLSTEDLRKHVSIYFSQFPAFKKIPKKLYLKTLHQMLEQEVLRRDPNNVKLIQYL